MHLVEKIELGLSNRDGELFAGFGSDGKYYLVLQAESFHNKEYFDGEGSTEHVEITDESYYCLSTSSDQTKGIK